MISIGYDPAGEEWCPRFHRDLWADRAFRRVRSNARLRAALGYLRALRRRWLSATGKGPSNSDATRSHMTGQFKFAMVTLPFGRITGIVAEHGRTTTSLPALPRSAREAWRRLYEVPDPPVAARPRLFSLPDGYFLADRRAHLVVEVLKAKGLQEATFEVLEPVLRSAVPYRAFDRTPSEGCPVSCEPPKGRDEEVKLCC